MRSEQHRSDELEALRSCRGASRYETCMYACNVDVVRRNPWLRCIRPAKPPCPYVYR